MKSPIYLEWIAEERKEAFADGEAIGKAKGRQETLQTIIIEDLWDRFTYVREELCDQIKKVDDLNILKILQKKVDSVEIPEDFVVYIKNVTS